MERSRGDERDGTSIEDLAQQVADLTGETPEEASAEEAKKAGPLPLWRQAAIDAIVARCAALPVLDTRSADEIIGYDENGLPS